MRAAPAGKTRRARAPRCSRRSLYKYRNPPHYSRHSRLKFFAEAFFQKGRKAFCQAFFQKSLELQDGFIEKTARERAVASAAVTIRTQDARAIGRRLGCKTQLDEVEAAKLVQTVRHKQRHRVEQLGAAIRAACIKGLAAPVGYKIFPLPAPRAADKCLDRTGSHRHQRQAAVHGHAARNRRPQRPRRVKAQFKRQRQIAKPPSGQRLGRNSSH